MISLEKAPTTTDRRTELSRMHGYVLVLRAV
jgi:hypothetical protein